MSTRRLSLIAVVLVILGVSAAAWYLLRTAPAATPTGGTADETARADASKAPGSTAGAVSPRTLADLPAAAAPADLDLSHVEVTRFAEALGKDPARIFNYVRDGIAYELYTGSLRGPRGTLLALAGNSVDRAALLASLLQEAGQKVRFAGGELAVGDAAALVTSMWAARTPPVPAAATAINPALAAAGATFAAAVSRDYRAITELLQAASRDRAPAPIPTFDQLVAEARPHYWVQWMKDGEWVNLDPSFADSAPGRSYASVSSSFDTLPESVFHKVEIRVRVEELADDKLGVREVLKFSTRAAALPAVDVLLAHVPENWNGSPDLQSAMASALEDTSRVKPVLALGDRMIDGRAFQQKPPQTKGLGGLGNLLGGRGARTEAPLAIAEFIEFEFTAPDGARQTVVRDVFDLLGPSRRRALNPVTPAELSSLASAPDNTALTSRLYSLLFSTGRIVENHLTDGAPASSEPADVDRTLRRLGIAIQAASDVMTAKLMEQDDGLRVYLNAPRLTIVELQERSAGQVQLSIDLRHDAHRAVARDGRQSAVVSVSVARGVVASTLERMILDLAFAQGKPGESQLAVATSASAVFEAAAAARIPSSIMSIERGRSTSDIPRDALARIEADTAAGFLVIAPERAVTVGGRPRYAWWRIDPRTGDTIGVTDDGLHGSSRVWQEYIYRTERNRDGVLVVRAYYRDVFGRLHLVHEIDPRAWPGGLSAVFRWLRDQDFLPSFRPQL